MIPLENIVLDQNGFWDAILLLENNFPLGNTSRVVALFAVLIFLFCGRGT
jgi:hypothetical protein